MSFLSSFKVFANFSTVSTAIQQIYTVLTKLLTVVNVISTESQGTAAAPVVGKYVPVTSSTVSKIIAAIEKFAPLFGITLNSNVSAQSVTDPKADLIAALKDLDAILK